MPIFIVRFCLIKIICCVNISNFLNNTPCSDPIINVVYCVVNVSVQILSWLKWTTCPLRLHCTGFHLSWDHCCAALFGMAVLDWTPQTASALQTSKQGKEDFWSLLFNTQPVNTTVRTTAMLWSSSSDTLFSFFVVPVKKIICCVIIPNTFFFWVDHF